MDLKNGTKNRGQKSAKNRKVVKDFLKEVFGNIGSISYASSNFIHFRKCPECERSEPLFPLNFVLQFHVLLHSGDQDSAFNQRGEPWDRVLAKSSAADFPTKGLHG
jgi:hypothetical protein